jgi:hypothetical protein
MLMPVKYLGSLASYIVNKHNLLAQALQHFPQPDVLWKVQVH